MKPYIHVVGALTLWIFAVVLLANVQNTGTPTGSVMLRMDQVKTYAIQKIPINYDYARSMIINNFNTYWIPQTDEGTGCLGLTQFNGTVNSACATKRNALVTTTRALMGCDTYKAPGCNCLNQLLKGISQDNSTGTVNTYTGTFIGKGLNMTGRFWDVLAALEACHFLHHSPYVATQNGNTLVRRVGLLFFLTTVVTGNVFYQFFILPWVDSRGAGWSRLIRIVGVLIWPLVGLFTVIGLEIGASNIMFYITLPPLFLLVWYDLFLQSVKHPKFMHPYFFATILSTFWVMALIENSVFDYDNIVVEIWKSHLIACVYFAVSWFYTDLDSADKEHKREFYKKPAQDAIYIGAVLAVSITFSTCLSPFTAVAYFNLLWYVPLAFVLLCFFSVLWVGEQDRFYQFYYDADIDKKVVSKASVQGVSFYIPTGKLYVSAILLLLVQLVVIYYWRDFSSAWHAIYENIPMRSVQYNTSYSWLNNVN